MITKPQLSQSLARNKKLVPIALKLDTLIDALNERPVPSGLTDQINNRIRSIDAADGSATVLVREMTSVYKEILKLIEKELGLITKHHHRNIWLALGMSTFGVPAGLIFSIITGNYGLFSIGLPIGMGAGVALGTALDRKAATEGRQLNIE
ncbi:MAG TPA: hypothetical protein VGE15_08915 [Sphingobacteriaceae bacterium]